MGILSKMWQQNIMYNEELEIEREIGLIEACVLSSIVHPKKTGRRYKKI